MGDRERFQSTLSVWRATQLALIPFACPKYFNPRSPCGERPCYKWPVDDFCNHFNPRSPCGERPSTFTVIGDVTDISIHALRVESDWRHIQSAFIPGISIHALRVESDIKTIDDLIRVCISIHALRVESDSIGAEKPGGKPDFNPRSPCGERPGFNGFFFCAVGISIHALRVESDTAAL